jgi:hypothetical protein
LELAAEVADFKESGLLQLLYDRLEEPAWHQKVRGVVIGLSLFLLVFAGSERIRGIVKPTNRRAAAMEVPVPEFMPERKPVAFQRARGANSCDSPVTDTDECGCASVQVLVSNLEPSIKGDSFNVDVLRTVDTE